MAKARIWSALSAAYKRRLEKAGVNRAAYEGGVSLKAARGHSHTPEHPRDIIGNGEKFPSYHSRLKELQAEVIRKKERVWGHSHKFNRDNSARNVREGVKDYPDKGLHSAVPGVRQLLRVVDMSDDEMEDFLMEPPEDEREAFAWLFYH